jgi:UDP:flavonoid glycosyltransferase YjiC (YdhE family)
MGHAALLDRVIRVVSPLAVRAVVTTGPGIDPHSLHAAPHIAVRASAPHAAILREAALVITHAGHGTVIRALAHGVPLITLPMGRDQADNAARVVAAGAGIRLSPRSSETTLRSAVERALSDSSLREGAARAKDILARERVGDPAVEELEALLHRA